MKRTLVILIALLFVVSSAFADTEIVSLTANGGYSNITDASCFGMGGNYMYNYEASNTTSIGIGEHCDVTGFTTNAPALSVGSITGLSFETQTANNIRFNMIVGPAFQFEFVDEDAYVGFGLGADLSYNLYLDPNNTIGFTFGATAYAKFATFKDDDETNLGFSYQALGYCGLVFRFDGIRPWHPGYYYDYPYRYHYYY